jgi:YbbR domain-containing protein
MAWHPFRNFGLKAVALVLGTLLWMTVSGNQVERRVPLGILFSNVPAGLELVGEQGEAVVYVRGADTVVSALGPGSLRTIVDLNAAHPGANLIALSPDQVLAPTGVDVLSIDPGSVTVTFERSDRQEALVFPVVEGNPAAGFQITRIDVEPRTVSVMGPESRLREPVSVVTERVLVDGQTKTVTRDVSVGVVDSQVRLVETKSVRVTVHIARRVP